MITVSSSAHRAFSTVTVEVPFALRNTYESTGALVSDGAETMLSALAHESGTVSGTPMAGYSSAAVRVFRCARGDPDQDPDFDAQCSGTGACRDVDGVEICAGADLLSAAPRYQLRRRWPLPRRLHL